jgi:uncharacterized membrane protein
MIDSTAILLMCLGVLLAVAVAHDVIRRRRKNGESASAAMMRAAGLSRADRRVLKQIARTASLPNVGCMLISRGCFDHAAQSAIEHGMDRGVINDLQRRIGYPG